MSRSELSSVITNTLFEALASAPDGLHRTTVWNHVLRSNPGLEKAWEEAVEGRTSPFTHMGWVATKAVKAGWLRKDGNGSWELTGAGRHALSEHREKGDLGSLIRTRYQVWAQARGSYELACEVLQSLPEGRWVCIEDLADLTGLDETLLAQYLSAVRPEGWHRVMDEDGHAPKCAHFTDKERAEAGALLEADAILGPSGWTLTSYRVSRQELTEQISSSASGSPPEETAVPARAWLLRAPRSTGDSDTREVWLTQGFCSVDTLGVDTLDPGVDESVVRNTVQRLRSHWSASEQGKLTFTLHTFTSKVRAGDFILTNIGREVHLGTVADDELRSGAPSARGHLTRTVSWHTQDSPLDLTGNLSAELAARIGTPNTELLELTGFRRELEQLINGPHERPAPVQDAELPEPTEEFARSVFMDREWLAECVDLLRERPQLVLYGPPGTGKTYLAQELARHLTGDRPENTQLVQFHPSYSYEDFFEGYRPHPGDSEHPSGFTLTHGPLRSLANAARKHPGEPFVLIIDEINRGHLAKVFGELYYLLEYRNRSVRLLYGTEADPGFDLPRNLFIIGTMNTADRSIALVDTAMRRRFWFAELHPSAEPVASVLPRWLRHHALPETAALLLDELNGRIDDRDFRIGPSYLMRPSVHTAKGMDRVWRHQILPLLEEHHYGDGTDVTARYGLASLRKALDLTESP
ncbi:McrB family protein [Nocardiopsis tropica]|uniref:AAA family ATPase n=1 Tax=Nocardiopsis tropica TaxID=109330 RepID=A0ABU7KIA9_9ACTN|nr:AAA family ATPase [Nocardiopsis umidischolae]MEE2049022.1 AAA family ATPase [Nocardiopsis umidischolae]